MPLFSVIIPTFDREKEVTRAIDSVLSQAFTDFEIIVVDDGSTDNTEASIQFYFSKPRFHYVKQENKGVASARNLGASKATGEFLVFLDSDDQLSPNSLPEYHQ